MLNSEEVQRLAAHALANLSVNGMLVVNEVYTYKRYALICRYRSFTLLCS